jgi:hypothetical protein
VDTLSPGLLSLVMTGAYHAFPDTAQKDAESQGGAGDEMSVEAAAMAYLMRGIHF